MTAQHPTAQWHQQHLVSICVICQGFVTRLLFGLSYRCLRSERSDERAGWTAAENGRTGGASNIWRIWFCTWIQYRFRECIGRITVRKMLKMTLEGSMDVARLSTRGWDRRFTETFSHEPHCHATQRPLFHHEIDTVVIDNCSRASRERTIFKKCEQEVEAQSWKSRLASDRTRLCCEGTYPSYGT